MTDDGRLAVVLGQFHGVERFGERADLVHFDEDRVGPGAGVDAGWKELDVGGQTNRHRRAAPYRRGVSVRPSPVGPIAFRRNHLEWKMIGIYAAQSLA